MKKTILIHLMLIIPILTMASNGFEEAMQKAIDKMYKARELAEYIEVANQFDRIAKAEPEEWLPSYYASFCYAMISGLKDQLAQADSYLDNADEYLEEALRKNGDQVEIMAMQSLTNMMRISVDPATRGQEYSLKSAQYLQQAAQIDENNPRVLLMMGQLQFGTAKFFGSGIEEPCNTFRKSIELFEAEENEEPGINPSWGKQQAISMLKNCEG